MRCAPDQILHVPTRMSMALMTPVPTTDVSANIGGLRGAQVCPQFLPNCAAQKGERSTLTCARGSIEWPDFVIQALSALRIFAQMNFLTLQGLSCVFLGISFRQQLFSYTMGMLALIMTLFLPVPCAAVRGFRNHDVHHVRWRQTLGNPNPKP